MNKITILDAFAGIGGIRLEFELANNIFSTVYAVDIEPKCKETYDLNFSTGLTIAGISKLNVDNIPNHDIFTAGFPCQSWSIAGQKKDLTMIEVKLCLIC